MILLQLVPLPNPNGVKCRDLLLGNERWGFWRGNSVYRKVSCKI